MYDTMIPYYLFRVCQTTGNTLYWTDDRGFSFCIEMDDGQPLAGVVDRPEGCTENDAWERETPSLVQMLQEALQKNLSRLDWETGDLDGWETLFYRDLPGCMGTVFASRDPIVWTVIGKDPNGIGGSADSVEQAKEQVLQAMVRDVIVQDIYAMLGEAIANSSVVSALESRKPLPVPEPA